MGKNRHASREESAFFWRGLGVDKVLRSRTGFGGASIESYRFPHRSPRKSGPDFVLVHGIGVSSRAYGPVAAALAEDGDVHLIDLPGYGRSPRPDATLTIPQHADVLAAYLREKQLDHPVLVGHSMGAQVVADLATRYPQLVDHLVLIAPVMTPDARRIRPALRRFLGNARHEPLTMTAVAITDYLVRSGLPYSLAQTKHLLGTVIEDALPTIQAKTLVICGTKDPVSPPEWGQQLTELLPLGWFATTPGAHGAMWVSPENLSELIDEHARR